MLLLLFGTADNPDVTIDADGTIEIDGAATLVARTNRRHTPRREYLFIDDVAGDQAGVIS